jgi:hypothetical protein
MFHTTVHHTMKPTERCYQSALSAGHQSQLVLPRTLLVSQVPFRHTGNILRLLCLPPALSTVQ